jgi:hypothetical protein
LRKQKVVKKFPAKLNDLHFDPDNPRLPPNFGDDQAKIFRYLINDIGVEDLLESIAASGLFSADPIIVRDRPSGGYYVIEGNRRLAALKLLSGERPDDQLPTPKVPVVSSELLKSFKSLTVESGWPNDLLQAYLGYKHVTAAREWLPEAKAKFVYEHAQGNLSNENLRKFAKTVGTNLATLKRWLIAYLTLRQAEQNGTFDPTNTAAKGYFGTFYTLLGGSQAREFLQLKSDPVTEHPIPKDHLDELNEFINWTIGTKDKLAVINSRQQAKFEQVLSSPRALEHFRVKGDLEASLLYTEYNAEEIASALREAAYTIEGCLTMLFDVRENTKVTESFGELERAYRKARLNIQGKE